MAKDHGPQIKDDATFEALIAQGASPGKAARIANAAAAGTLNHNGVQLEDRTVEGLRAEAAKTGIAGRSAMNKEALIEAIRDHR